MLKRNRVLSEPGKAHNPHYKIDYRPLATALESLCVAILVGAWGLAMS